MNAAYGAPNSRPIGWRPRTTAANRFARPPRGAATAELDTACRHCCATSWLIFEAAPASASAGSCLPKITDFVHASRNVCQTSIEFGTFGTSTTLVENFRKSHAVARFLHEAYMATFLASLNVGT